MHAPPLTMSANLLSQDLPPAATSLAPRGGSAVQRRERLARSGRSCRDGQPRICRAPANSARDIKQ